MVMAAAYQGDRIPDLYELLEVGRGASAGQAHEPPLRAGPVWVEVPGAVPAAGPRTAEEDTVRLAVLAELTVRYLAGEWGWPW